jgi:3-keto-5-aminohexanoate cleavage enzyme
VFVINFTPTGMIPTKDMTPHVPVTPAEIVAEVLEAARNWNVSMVHLHARDGEGKPTYRKEVYAEIIAGIRAENNELIICVSTSGRSWSRIEKRSECLELDGDLKPDMASLTLSSLNFNNQASISEPVTIKALAQKMLHRGIKPELEAFDTGMINYAKYLARKGFIMPPFYFNLILGNVACAQADAMSLGMMIDRLPEDSIWSAGGIGDAQLKVNVLGLVSGGGVRVGLEDNIWWTPERKILAANMMLLSRINELANLLHIKPATPGEVRNALRLPK